MQRDSRAKHRVSKVEEPISRSERMLIQGASHSLINSVTACRWHLDLLSGDAEKQGEKVALVTDELERMERLLDDLGLVIEGEEPGFLSPEAIDLELIVHELVVKASELGDRDWTVDEADGTLFGDPDRLTRAVMKLAHNAVEHTDRGDTVAIGGQAGNGEARIWVRDTGSGIPPDEQADIVDAFARGTESRRRYRGSGLGLTVVQVVAEAHGGWLEIESRVGEGSKFTIVVPVAR